MRTNFVGLLWGTVQRQGLENTQRDELLNQKWGLCENKATFSCCNFSLLLWNCDSCAITSLHNCSWCAKLWGENIPFLQRQEIAVWSLNVLQKKPHFQEGNCVVWPYMIHCSLVWLTDREHRGSVWTRTAISAEEQPNPFPCFLFPDLKGSWGATICPLD